MEKKLLEIKELSAYLGVKVNTLYSWVNQQKIPYVKINRLVRFEIQRIDEWLEKKAVETHPLCDRLR